MKLDGQSNNLTVSEIANMLHSSEIDKFFVCESMLNQTKIRPEGATFIVAHPYSISRRKGATISFFRNTC